MKNNSKELPTSDAVLQAILKRLDDRKAGDICTITLKGKSDFADYMVIACGTSSRQISGFADFICEDLKAMNCRDIYVDGQQLGNWILVDAGDVIVHLFRPEVREFYDLEKLWG